jgi:hypothetical protein
MTSTMSAAGAAVDTVAETQGFFVDDSGFLTSDSITVLADWKACAEKIQTFRQLADDWDGDGAAAPEPNVIDVATTVAHNLSRKMPAPDRIHVGVNGTIYFEWFAADRYIEIEVVGPADIQCRAIPHGSSDLEQSTLPACQA